MKQSGVKIAYSSDELQKDQVVSVDIQTSDILTALRSVLGDGYSFKQIEDYIAIARKEISDASDIVSNIADDIRCIGYLFPGDCDIILNLFKRITVAQYRA